MTWTDLSGAFGYGTKLTSSQMQQLRDNITALANGDSGAPPIVRDALETDTGSASGSLTGSGDTVAIAGDAYCLAQNHYTSQLQALKLTGHSSSVADQTARWGWYNSGAGTYSYYDRWRYLTATDNPFIYFIRNKATGEIKHLWESGDPPYTSLWRLDQIPDDYERPIIDSGIDLISNFDEFTLHKYPMDDFLALRDRIKAAPEKLPFKAVDDAFDFDQDKRLFKPKNLIAV